MAEEKRTKKIERKIEGQVFDHYTLFALHKLMRSKFFDSMGGPIAVGKEANVFKAYKEGKLLAVKIYRIETTSFKNMLPYIQGDPRFRVGKDRKEIIFTWAKKELRNLRKAYRAGAVVPLPITSLRNILVMEFIGETLDSEKPAPLLKNTFLENPKQVLAKIIESTRAMYKDGLVHADLSEFNVMMRGEQPVIIDMGQAVVLEHPRATEFLRRDCEKMAKFFSKLGLEITEEEIFSLITK